MKDRTPINPFIEKYNEKTLINILKSKNIEKRFLNSEQLFDLIDKQTKLKSRTRDQIYDYEKSYHSLEEIYAQLDRINKIHTKNVFLYSIGMTFENRSLNVLKLFGDNKSNKIVVIECGIHAREWISPAFCMWTINRLLSKPDLLTIYQFLIIPVLNPDGYVMKLNYYNLNKSILQLCLFLGNT